MNYLTLVDELRKNNFTVLEPIALKPIIFYTKNGVGFELVVLDKVNRITGLRAKHSSDVFATFTSAEQAYSYIMKKYC